VAADDSLSGVSVLVAGAGLAGLVAARDLADRGAAVRVIEARDRVGGRVLTARNGFVDGQYAELGGDMIDEQQHEIRTLAGELGLSLVRVLSTGFGYARVAPNGKIRLVPRSSVRGWDRLAAELSGLARRYRWAERRWDSPVSADIARHSVGAWLDQVQADAELRTAALGLRGFFLADPEELSLLALVDQFASDNEPAPGRMYRIDGGNDRLAAALAAPLEGRLHLSTEVLGVSQRGGTARVSLRSGRRRDQVTVDYVVFALPAPLLRRIPITPALPVQQHEAIASLKYGRGTKTLLQFTASGASQADRAPSVPPCRSALVGTPMSSRADGPGSCRSSRAGPPAMPRPTSWFAKASPASSAASTGSARRKQNCSTGRRRAGSRTRGPGADMPCSTPRSRPRCGDGSRSPVGACSSPASTPACAGRVT
jgi:monoamine oxidase